MRRTGDVEEELPKDASPATTSPTRIIPARAGFPDGASRHSLPSSPAPRSPSTSTPMQRTASASLRALGPKGIRFIDKDEHVYFWFPLLAGLSELTFDPRQEIRSSALEVLFDTLKFHGSSFAQSFWARILDSVLLPIFDHVRAEVMNGSRKRELCMEVGFIVCCQILCLCLDASNP